MSLRKKFFEPEASNHSRIVETERGGRPKEGKVRESFGEESAEVEVVADAAAKEDGFTGESLRSELGFARDVLEGCLLKGGGHIGFLRIGEGAVFDGIEDGSFKATERKVEGALFDSASGKGVRFRVARFGDPFDVGATRVG